MPRTTTKTIPIEFQARESQRNLIDSAAQALGKTRSDFILETVCREAERVLLDQHPFNLDAEAFDTFCHALEAPARDYEALRVLLSRKTPWD